MWNFEDYYARYLTMCKERNVRPFPALWLRERIGMGANPADAFTFYDHQTVEPDQQATVVTLGASGYDKLGDVLRRAFDQAAVGKGAERHADNKPFHEQPMQLIADKRGIGFILGQADKKSEEAQGMLNRGQHEACVKELLGAIVYLAGAVIFVEKNL